MTYENFIVPNIYWEYVLAQHRISFINEYYKMYKKYPSDKEVLEVVLSAEEKERYKRLFYAQYKATGIIPSEPDIPDEPDNPSYSGETNNNEWFTMLYDVTSIAEPTKLFNDASIQSINTLVIDGKQIDATSTFSFNTLGQHEVKILLKEQSNNGNLNFTDISQLKELTIPSNISTLGESFLYNCQGLEKITSYASSAPFINVDKNYTFYELKQNGVLLVPKNSNYIVWTNTFSRSVNLGTYNWITEYME